MFRSHSTYCPTREKITIINHYNLTGNLCVKHLTQQGTEPRIFSLQYQLSNPELSDHTAGWTCNTHKIPNWVTCFFFTQTSC